MESKTQSQQLNATLEMDTTIKKSSSSFGYSQSDKSVYENQEEGKKFEQYVWKHMTETFTDIGLQKDLTQIMYRKKKNNEINNNNHGKQQQKFQSPNTNKKRNQKRNKKRNKKEQQNEIENEENNKYTIESQTSQQSTEQKNEGKKEIEFDQIFIIKNEQGFMQEELQERLINRKYVLKKFNTQKDFREKFEQLKSSQQSDHRGKKKGKSVEKMMKRYDQNDVVNENNEETKIQESDNDSHQTSESSNSQYERDSNKSKKLISFCDLWQNSFMIEGQENLGISYSIKSNSSTIIGHYPKVNMKGNTLIIGQSKYSLPYESGSGDTFPQKIVENILNSFKSVEKQLVQENDNQQFQNIFIIITYNGLFDTKTEIKRDYYALREKLNPKSNHFQIQNTKINNHIQNFQEKNQGITVFVSVYHMNFRKLQFLYEDLEDIEVVVNNYEKQLEQERELHIKQTQDMIDIYEKTAQVINELSISNPSIIKQFQEELNKQENYKKKMEIINQYSQQQQ